MLTLVKSGVPLVGAGKLVFARKRRAADLIERFEELLLDVLARVDHEGLLRAPGGGDLVEVRARSLRVLLCEDADHERLDFRIVRLRALRDRRDTIDVRVALRRRPSVA